MSLPSLSFPFWGPLLSVGNPAWMDDGMCLGTERQWLKVRRRWWSHKRWRDRNTTWTSGRSDGPCLGHHRNLQQSPRYLRKNDGFLTSFYTMCHGTVSNAEYSLNRWHFEGDYSCVCYCTLCFGNCAGQFPVGVTVRSQPVLTYLPLGDAAVISKVRFSNLLCRNILRHGEITHMWMR